MAGYIKDHRKELESDIWLMPPLYHRVWQWLKYNANHADNEIPMRDGSKMLIQKGQRLTSIREIAKGVSWNEGKKHKEPNPKTISAILSWMMKANMVFINHGQGNREYTLITLVNYEFYNEKEIQGNAKVTVDGAGRKQHADINKNEKNEKNEKNDISSKDIVVPFAEIIDYLNLKAGKGFKAESKATREYINARWNEGYRVEHFKKVIDNKLPEWKGHPTNDMYLRPQTLFNSEKFEAYLNQLAPGDRPKKSTPTSRLQELYRKAQEEEERQ